MSSVFADSSFYIAAVNPRDVHHRDAMALASDFSEGAVTTEYVLIEVGNWLSRSGDRPVFIRLVEGLRQNSTTLVIPSDPELFRLGFDLYKRRKDKEWSLTDCISFVVMQQKRMTESLTADRHFEQAGFRVLLGPLEK